MTDCSSGSDSEPEMMTASTSSSTLLESSQFSASTSSSSKETAVDDVMPSSPDARPTNQEDKPLFNFKQVNDGICTMSKSISISSFPFSLSLHLWNTHPESYLLSSAYKQLSVLSSFFLSLFFHLGEPHLRAISARTWGGTSWRIWQSPKWEIGGTIWCLRQVHLRPNSTSPQWQTNVIRLMICNGKKSRDTWFP